MGVGGLLVQAKQLHDAGGHEAEVSRRRRVGELGVGRERADDALQTCSFHTQVAERVDERMS